MRPLRGELLLEAWEQGLAEPELSRALRLLSVSGADQTREELAALSVANCDAELLRLRQLTFGDALRGTLTCKSCATRMEFETSVGSLLDRIEAARPPDEAKWSVGQFTFSMRPVTTFDLISIASAPNPGRRLLERCTTVGGANAESALAETENSAVERFNRLNEGAETRFTLQCPACRETDYVNLDIGRFLWAEVRHAALSLLRDVHELASAYGWTEGTILEMSATRRASYLEMARA